MRNGDGDTDRIKMEMIVSLLCEEVRFIVCYRRRENNDEITV